MAYTQTFWDVSLVPPTKRKEIKHLCKYSSGIWRGFCIQTKVIADLGLEAQFSTQHLPSMHETPGAIPYKAKNKADFSYKSYGILTLQVW